VPTTTLCTRRRSEDVVGRLPRQLMKNVAEMMQSPFSASARVSAKVSVNVSSVSGVGIPRGWWVSAANE
jgi:hypothetical protein